MGRSGSWAGSKSENGQSGCLPPVSRFSARPQHSLESLWSLSSPIILQKPWQQPPSSRHQLESRPISANAASKMAPLPVHITSQPSKGFDAPSDGKDSKAAAASSLLRPLRQCWGNAGVLPASATEAWICYIALAVFFPSTLLIKALGVSLHWRLVLTAAVPAAVVLVLEAVYCKVRQRHPAARNTSSTAAASRVWHCPHFSLLASQRFARANTCCCSTQPACPCSFLPSSNTFLLHAVLCTVVLGLL